jgi:hypothetical protein
VAKEPMNISLSLSLQYTDIEFQKTLDTRLLHIISVKRELDPRP